MRLHRFPVKQAEHRRAVFLQSFTLRLGVSAQRAVELLFAAPRQVGVEVAETREARHRHEEVAPVVTNEAFHVALLVAPRHPAEPVGEEEVTLEPQELGREFSVGPFEDLLHRDRGVVVSDLGSYTAEELERVVVGLLEGLGALARVGRDEEGVRVGQAHHREGDLSSSAGDLDDRFAEIELRFARRLGERHEHLTAAVVVLGEVAPHLALGPLVAVFVA